MASNPANDKVMELDRLWNEPAMNLKLWNRRPTMRLKLLQGGMDFCLALLAFSLSCAVFEEFQYQTPALSLSHWVSVLLFSLMTIIFFPAQRLYSRHLVFSKRKHAIHLLKAFASSFLSLSFVVAAYALPFISKHYSLILLTVVFLVLFASSRFVRFERGVAFYLFKIFGIGMLALGVLGILYKGQMPDILKRPGTVSFGCGFAVVLLYSARLGIIHFAFNSTLKRHFRRQVAVVGSDAQGQDIVSYVIERNAPFWIAGTIGEQCHLDTKVRKHCLGTVRDLPRVVLDHKIDELLIADKGIDKRTLIHILDLCLGNGINVWFPPSFLEIIDQKLYIDNFCGLPMIKLCSPKRIWLVNKIKHALDAIVALPVFVLLSPLFGSIALAIKLTSPGPVFYRATAIGKGGREFTMYKFRSMRVNNDAQIHRSYVTRLIKGEIGSDDEPGQPLKITNDPRITSVGKILRKFSLDELPQLINVIKGDMSLVGPRPCLPYEFEVYEDWYKKRASIRPGITGLWQVAGRSEVAFEDMILLDLYYVYNRGIWMDLNILIETVFAVIEKRGAY